MGFRATLNFLGTLPQDPSYPRLDVSWISKICVETETGKILLTNSLLENLVYR